MKKIKSGDQVVVIAGRDKGKKGVVKTILTTGKLVVEGINIVKKHLKANPNANDQGGIVLKALPIDRSNVMLYDSASEKGSRVGIKVSDNGNKVRYFKSTNEVVEETT